MVLVFFVSCACVLWLCVCCVYLTLLTVVCQFVGFSLVFQYLKTIVHRKELVSKKINGQYAPDQAKFVYWADI